MQPIKSKYAASRNDLIFCPRDNSLYICTSYGKMKYFDAPVIEEIDSVWVARKLTMTTKKGKKTTHRTELNFKNIRFNQDLDESMFSIRRIEKGL